MSIIKLIIYLNINMFEKDSCNTSKDNEIVVPEFVISRRECKHTLPIKKLVGTNKLGADHLIPGGRLWFFCKKKIVQQISENK